MAHFRYWFLEYCFNSLIRNGSSRTGFFFTGCDFMDDTEFKQMLAELITKEEVSLQVNSKEFWQRHEEIMELIRNAGGKE